MTREELINSPEYKEENDYIDAWRDGYKEAVAETCKWLKKEFRTFNPISVEAMTDKYYEEIMGKQQ